MAPKTKYNHLFFTTYFHFVQRLQVTISQRCNLAAKIPFVNKAQPQRYPSSFAMKEAQVLYLPQHGCHLQYFSTAQPQSQTPQRRD